VTGDSDIVTAHSDKRRKSVTVISESSVTPSESPVTPFRNQRSRCVGIRISVITRDGIPVEFETGWDATARGFFLIVRLSDLAANDEWDDAELFNTDRLPQSLALPQRYDSLNSILDGMGVVLPPSVLGDLMIGPDRRPRVE
jgi:hypothetical protein